MSYGPIFHRTPLSSKLTRIRALVQLAPTWNFSQEYTTEYHITMDIAVVNPASPILTAPVDLALAHEGVRTARKFFTVHAWDGYVLDEVAPTASDSTDEEIDTAIRPIVDIVQHPVSMAAMPAKDATYGVVGPNLKVKKTQGLRIVDASAMPYIVAAHTQVAVYVIAERATDLILQDWAH